MPDKAISTGTANHRRPYPTWVKHFYNCREHYAFDPGNDVTPASTAITEMADIAGSTKLRTRHAEVIGGVVQRNQIPANSVFDTGHARDFNRVKSWTGTAAGNTLDPAGPGWVSPGSRDAILLCLGFARHDVGIDPDYGGFLSIYCGDAATGQLKVQPYYAMFQDTRASASQIRRKIATPFAAAYATRTAGTFYAFAAVKRGTVLEHYAQGALTGSVDLAAHYGAELLPYWQAWAPDPEFHCGHSTYNTSVLLCDPVEQAAGACETIGEEIPGRFVTPANAGEYPQDYAGLLLGVFEQGAPPQAVLEAGMLEMLASWAAGNKRFPFDWYRYR